MITPFMKIIGWVVVLLVILLIYNFIRLIPEKAKVKKEPIDIRDYNNLQNKINKLNKELNKKTTKIEKLEIQNSNYSTIEKKLDKEKKLIIKEKTRVDSLLFKLRKKQEENEKSGKSNEELDKGNKTLITEKSDLTAQKEKLLIEIREFGENLSQLNSSHNNQPHMLEQEEGKSMPERSELKNLINCLLPNLEFNLQPLDEILRLVQNKNNILSKLYRLNIDPKQIRSERVESTKSWDETHFHTGINNDGRLYYQRKSNGKIQVLVGLKGTQKFDIQLLLKNG